MGRLSRGCKICRQRRVRCDEGRPSCRRCILRNEICEGYRDESSLIFRHETDKVIEQLRVTALGASQVDQHDSSHQAVRIRSKSVDMRPISQKLRSALNFKEDPGAISRDEALGIKLDDRQPWLQGLPKEFRRPIEEQVVDQYMERYVVYPCNQKSSPGFLEHLPSMFKEVNVEGRYSLRWAVQAAAYADASRNQESNVLAIKALDCYGMALKAFGESLSVPSKVPDDYDLMTVVMLDIFETLYVPNEVKKGSHVQGMAQILRLRGSDVVYSSRGWSLFRLAHHRIQKQRLSHRTLQQVDVETSEWLNQLNDAEPYVRLEKSAHGIGETCKRARFLLDHINAGGLPAPTLIDMIKELQCLDQGAVTWRQTSQWSFRSIALSDRPDLLPAVQGITDTIQLHSDVWMAYEWNYHRTARIIFLQQVLQCAKAALELPDIEEDQELDLHQIMATCIFTIQWLADEFLATVPQSLGDIDHMGQLLDEKHGEHRCRGIGGYLLLWPTRTVKAEKSAATLEQKERAERVFERIREYTGMKDLLGEQSII